MLTPPCAILRVSSDQSQSVPDRVYFTDGSAEDSADDNTAEPMEVEEGDEKPSSFPNLRLLDDEAEDSDEEGDDEEVGGNEYVADGFLVDEEESSEEDAPAGCYLRHILFVVPHTLLMRHISRFSKETQKIKPKIRSSSPGTFNGGSRRHAGHRGIEETTAR